MRRAGLLLALALAGPAAAAAEQRSDWRQVVTVLDRKRLRDWRTALITGLADARRGGNGATIAADPTLFDPDAALIDRPSPPVGDYRCRHLKLGAGGGGTGLGIEDWGRCTIDGAEAPLRLIDFHAGQRPTGLIYPDIDRHAVFLGTMMLGDEHRPATYGHAAGRDMAGVVERIGEHRWRLVLPYPRFGGVLDVVELVPAGS